MLSHPHRFVAADLVGGNLAVDFINTVNDRDVCAQNWTGDYEALLAWAALTGAVSGEELEALDRRRLADPGLALAALHRAWTVRDHIHDVLRAAVERRTPEPGAVEGLERAWRDAAAVTRLQSAGGDYRAEISLQEAGLDLIRHRAVVSAMALLTGEKRVRLRRCDGPRCGWLFVDQSKAGRRRWCDMATCGNHEKAKRFAARRRIGASKP